MSNIKIKRDVEFSDWVMIFVKPWVVMLAIGALGHRLGIPYLFRFGYWDVLLLNLALGVVRSTYPGAWKVENWPAKVFKFEIGNSNKKGKK